MTAPLWQEGRFLIATAHGPEGRRGHTYAGLGMHKIAPASPKGRRPPLWTLTHLGTGHNVCNIAAHMAEAFEIATEIADCGEWDFDGLEGYRNRDPALFDKARAVLSRHAKCVSRVGRPNHSEAAARAVAEARA